MHSLQPGARHNLWLVPRNQGLALRQCEHDHAVFVMREGGAGNGRTDIIGMMDDVQHMLEIGSDWAAYQ